MKKALLLLVGCAAAGLCQHPRIWLSPTVLSSLRSRAAAGDPAWIELRNQCNSYVNGVVFAPKSLQGRYDFFASGSDYSRENAVNPNIGPGYQGAGGGSINGYWDATLNLGMCYQVTIAGPAQDLAAAAGYAAKAIETLTVMAYRPGTMFVNSGARQGLTRYVYDSSFAAGTAWAAAGIVVDGAVSAGSQSIPLRGLAAGGTVLAGDGFQINQKSYIVKADTVADTTGRATIQLGSLHARGGTVSNATTATALVDGTPLGHEIVVQSTGHGLKTGDSVTISGVGGNGNANGTFPITQINGDFGFLLSRTGATTAAVLRKHRCRPTPFTTRATEPGSTGQPWRSATTGFSTNSVQRSASTFATPRLAGFVKRNATDTANGT